MSAPSRPSLLRPATYARGIPAANRLLLRGLVAGLTLTGLTDAFAQGGDPAQGPLLAIVTAREKTGFEELLLARLAEKTAYRIVERDDLWRAHQEIATAGGMKAAMDAALELKAQGLLITTGDKDLNVKLVETSRGVVLGQWTLPAAALQSSAETLAGALGVFERQLLVPPKGRLYVSLRDASALDAAQPGGVLAARIPPLLAHKLIWRPELVVLEREHLATVAMEAAPAAAPERPPASADVVITTKCEPAPAGGLTCTLQVRLLARNEMRTTTVDVGLETLGTATDALVAFIGTACLADAGAAPATTPTAHSAESALYQHLAVLARTHNDHPRAITLQELAMLLAPDDAPARTRYLELTLAGLNQSGSPSREKDLKGFTRSLLQQVYWTQQSLRLAKRLDRKGQLAWLLPDRRFYQSLAFVTDNDSEEVKREVGLLRKDLRALLPDLPREAALVTNWEGFDRLVAAFFDNPAEAMAYYGKVCAQPGYPFFLILRSELYRTNPWDPQESMREWRRMMAGFEKAPDVRSRAVYRLERCNRFHFMVEFGGAEGARNLAVTAAADMFDWLLEDASARVWFGDQFALIERHVFDALPYLDARRQTVCLERLILPWVRKSPNAGLGAKLEIFVKKAGPQMLTADPNAPAVLRELFKTAHFTTGGGDDPARFERWLEPRLRVAWVADLFRERAAAPAPPTEADVPPLAGGRLVLDSRTMAAPAGASAPPVSLQRVGGLVDGNDLWLAWPENDGLSLTRFDLATGRPAGRNVLPVAKGNAPPPRIGEPTEAQRRLGIVAGHESVTLVLCRIQSSLAVALSDCVMVVPLADKVPALDFAQYRRFGPDLGAHNLEAFAPLGNGVYVTALTAGEKDLYVSLGRRGHLGRNTLGVIYRWDGVRPPELLAASDSLAEGPLNNCAPYRVYGGFYEPAAHALHFVLQASDGIQPTSAEQGQRAGIWEFNETTRQWRQRQARPFWSLTNLAAAQCTRPGQYDFPGHRYDPKLDVLTAGPGELASPDFRFGLSAKWSVANSTGRRELVLTSPARPQGTTLGTFVEDRTYLSRMFSHETGFYILVEHDKRALLYHLPFPGGGASPVPAPASAR